MTRSLASTRPVSVGVDLVDVPGFAEQLADAASGFVDATFTAARAARREGRRAPARRALRRQGGVREGVVGLALRAAAAARRVDLREIEVVDDGYGRPALRLHGAVEDAVGPLIRRTSRSATTARRRSRSSSLERA